MYRSLTILGADDEAAARKPARLARLARHRSFVDRNMAVVFGAVCLIGVAWFLLMLGLKTGAGVIVYVIAAAFALFGFFRARTRWKLNRLDIVRQAVLRPQMFAFAHAKITGFTIRKEGSGQYGYEVADATVAFEPTEKKDTIQLVETFDNRIWHFEEGAFPIAARVVYLISDPTFAALITMSQAAINKIDPKKRVGSGDGLAAVLSVVMALVALAFFCVAIWIGVGAMMGHTK